MELGKRSGRSPWGAKRFGVEVSDEMKARYGGHRSMTWTAAMEHLERLNSLYARQSGEESPLRPSCGPNTRRSRVARLTRASCASWWGGGRESRPQAGPGAARAAHGPGPCGPSATSGGRARRERRAGVENMPRRLAFANTSEWPSLTAVRLVNHAPAGWPAGSDVPWQHWPPTACWHGASWRVRTVCVARGTRTCAASSAGWSAAAQLSGTPT